MADFAEFREVTVKATSFANKYYELMDKGGEHRAMMLTFFSHQLLSPGTPLMQWNGHALNNQAEVTTYLENLPKTRHELRSLDAQPLPGCQNSDSFLITVNGQVLYDDEHTRFFYERLVVAQMEGKFYIVNSYYRWTGEQFK